MTGTHWVDWHRPYDDPSSSLARRLAIVQGRIRAVLDTAPPGPIRVISICAGQGRDLLEVLVDHARRDDITGRLVELDDDNVAYARRIAADAGITGLELVCGDARRPTHTTVPCRPIWCWRAGSSAT